MTVNALPAWLKWARLDEIEYLCCFSSSSKSRTLEPSSTDPAPRDRARLEKHQVGERRLAASPVHQLPRSERRPHASWPSCFTGSLLQERLIEMRNQMRNFEKPGILNRRRRFRHWMTLHDRPCRIDQHPQHGATHEQEAHAAEDRAPAVRRRKAPFLAGTSGTCR